MLSIFMKRVTRGYRTMQNSYRVKIIFMGHTMRHTILKYANLVRAKVGGKLLGTWVSISAWSRSFRLRMASMLRRYSSQDAGLTSRIVNPVLKLCASIIEPTTKDLGHSGRVRSTTGVRTQRMPGATARSASKKAKATKRPRKR